MDLEKVKRVQLSCMTAELVAVVLANLIKDLIVMAVLTGIAVCLVVFHIGFSLRYWRCPHCGKYLGRTGGDHCQWCGESLYP